MQGTAQAARIIAEAPYRSAALWIGPLALVTAMLAVEFLGDWGRSWLAFDRDAIADGQWWRLITGNFAHLGWYHWFLNALGVLVLVLLCPQPLPPWVWGRRVLVIGLAMSLCLWLFVPQLDNYVGMSGVIHGLFVLGLVPQVRRGDLIALGCVLYLLGKIGWELYAGAPVSDEAAIGGRVVVESHLYGTLCATLYGVAFGSFSGCEGLGRNARQTKS
ncbi:rhombosortase [Sinimarinibacterium thermocellulolyticum]|uniref:rhombosortase n=1 Tax=Sinimarinibacterium thermocellulolyticum TaxID=3170016 RepID=UPI003339B37E